MKSSGVNLTDQLPLALRTEEQLGAQLEERGLSFLVPLLAIKADMGRQLEGEGAEPDAFLAWVMKSVPEEDRKETGFITSLVGAVVKHISEATTLAGEGSQDKEVVDKEAHRILGALSKAVKETNKEMGSRDHVHTGWCTGHNSHRRHWTKYRTIKYQSLVMPSQPRFPVASYVICV